MLRPPVFLFAFLMLLLAGCHNHINWQRHVSFRSYGKGLRLSQVTPEEMVHGEIKANMHYVSIGVESVFFRNLPESVGRKVALGFEINGLLLKGESVKTVLDVGDARGKHTLLSFNDLLVTKPILYRGGNVRLTLHFKGIPPAAGSNTLGRIAGAGDLLKSLDPGNTHALKTGLKLFNSIVGSAAMHKKWWKYSLILYPGESMFRDKPEQLFTAARHILLCLPPADAGGGAARLQPRYLLRMLKLKGRRLVWRDSGEAYHLTPYIILNIRRYKRYPNPGTKLKKMIKLVENLISEKSYGLAQSILLNLGWAINDDPVITENEKNLERLWRDFRKVRIYKAKALQKVSEAKERGDEKEWKFELKRALQQVNMQMTYLGLIRSQFAPILYTYEAKKIDYWASRLKKEGEHIARRIGEPIDKVSQVFNEYRRIVSTRGARVTEERSGKDYRPRALSSMKMPSEKELKSLSSSLSRDALWKKWWFWSLLGVAAVGMGVGGYFAFRPASAGPANPGSAALLPPATP